MIEQLWYTWSTTGLGHNVGLQVRAASSGLREINSKRHQEFRGYLNYYLPDGTDASAATRDTAPVTLAFLDMGATPVGYTNTHTLIHKVYKGLDAYGRAGAFFIHLVDNLNQDFVASDAIDRWASGFWSVSDTDNPPPPDHSLPQLRDTDLFTGPFDIQRSYSHELLRYENTLKQHLPYVIQAFLSLKPTQKLYILAPSDQVAILIWGLAHSLPRSLQKALNLTFSTYEKEVSRFPARVVGTCRATVFSKNSRGGVQQPLPSNAFSGIGPALAIDCETNVKAGLSKIDTAPATAAALAEYAQKATARLINGDGAWLAEKLELASKQKIVDVVAFLSFIKTHIDEKPLEMEEVDAKLQNPKQAAHDLGGRNTRASLLKHYKAQPEWRKNRALPALKNLRAIVVDTKNTELTKDEKEDLKNAFFRMANDAVEEFVRNLLNPNDNDEDNDIFEALKDLQEACLFENTENKIKTSLIQNTQQYVQYPDFQQIQRSLHWSKRFWLLQQAAFVHNAQTMQVDIWLIALWLPGSWKSLHAFLEARERFPDAWRSLAVNRIIQAIWTSYQSFSQNSSDARWLLEKHYATLFGAINELLQYPDTQQIALEFCIYLLSMIVKRKRGFWDALGYFWRKVLDIVLFIPRQFKRAWEDLRHMFGWGEEPQEDLILDWKTVVLPVLAIKIDAPGQPINLDGLLKAAQLQKEDHDFLLKEHSQHLLSPSHRLSPYMIEICGTFLNLLSDKVRQLEHKSDLQQLYDSKIQRALERLRQIPFSDENVRAEILDLLCLVVTTREKVFEWYLNEDKEFLPNLVHAIRSFRLTKNEAYMGNLYLMILKKLRSAQELRVIIDRLSYIFEGEGKQKSHPGDQRKLFNAFVNYAVNGKYIFPLEMLLIFIQLAFEYAASLQENSQKKFLESAFKSIDNTRSRTVPFKVLDKEVQRMFASDPDYLDLWKKYSPGDSVQAVILDGAAKSKKPETQSGQPNESGAAKSNGQALANQQGNAAQQPEKKNGKASSDTPGRPTPAQPSADNQGNIPPASWRYDQGQPVADNIGDPRNQPAVGYQPTQPASTNMQGQIYPPANGGQQGGNFMAGQDKQPVGNDEGDQQLQQPLKLREIDILSTVFGQYYVTKQNVGELAVAFKEYVDWRIPLLSKEHINKRKGEATNASYSQPDKVQTEKDMLEELKLIIDYHEQIQRLLENGILIWVTLENNEPEALQMYQSSLEADYTKLKKSPGYTNLVKRAKEGDIHSLFEICMRYCALSQYIQQKGIIYENMEYKDTKQWIEIMREQAVERK